MRLFRAQQTTAVKMMTHYQVWAGMDSWLMQQLSNHKLQFCVPILKQAEVWYSDSAVAEVKATGLLNPHKAAQCVGTENSFQMHQTAWCNYVCLNNNVNQQYISAANVQPPWRESLCQWITELLLRADSAVSGSVCTSSESKVIEGDSPQHISNHPSHLSMHVPWRIIILW